mmetsp:Transcript_35042/g.87019  ORF Transcript_35042/g.87019 Transcript_35042/m.87019 type:complete len:200 (-) Transcript_35042:752-1351(-)
MRRDHRATRSQRSVQPHAQPRRRGVEVHSPGGWGEVALGVFRGHSALDGHAVAVEIVLREAECGQRGAFADGELGLDEVSRGDLLGDGVLHLQPCVDLDEVVPVVLVKQELNSAGILVADVLGQLDGVRKDLLAYLVGQEWRWGDLHDLLVPPLDGAVPLEQVHHVAVVVAHDLHLDVPPSLDQLLHKHRTVAERALGL